MLSTIDWLLITVYFASVVGLGIHFGRKQKDSRRYFLGTGRIPGWAVGISMFSTIISSWAFIALPGKSFQSDLQYLMAIAATPIAVWITVRYLIPIYRKKIRLSAYEYLEKRFGLPARLYGNLAFLIVHFGKMGAILYLLCLAISSMTGWDIYLLIVLVGAATLLYTWVGGIEGVIWTDVIQGLLLLASGLLALFFILGQSPGGAARVVDEAWSAGKLKLFSFEGGWESANTIVLFFFGLNYYLQKYVSDQTVVQRFLLSSTTRKAGRALWTSTGFIISVWILFMLLGALLWSFYELQPGLLPTDLQQAPDKAFPYFIGQQLPAGIRGIILAGLLAATMSTLSSDLNSLASIVTEDYWLRFRKGLTDEQVLRFSKVCVLISGILSILLALSMTRIGSMADAAFNFVSVVAGGLLGTYLLGIFDRRCSAGGLYLGLASALLFILWAYLTHLGWMTWAPRFPLNPLWIGLLGNLIVLVIGFLASRILPFAQKEIDLSLTAYDRNQRLIHEGDQTNGIR